MALETIQAGWTSILPPVIAITLALISKEVYSSLFVGILSGMCVYCWHTGGNLLQAVGYVFDMMAAKIGENGYMIIFLVLLGSLVVVVTRSGGSAAYGQWAGRRIKTAQGAKLTTSALGLLVFVDDGFNCLTVGTVMRPIADKCGVSREKLAYILDATAAPVCIIAPISSWAVAVASEVEEAGGLNAFVQTIPYNLYAILTLLMVFFLSFTDFDFGPMARAEQELRGGTDSAPAQPGESPKGRVIDLAAPIVTLIVCAILGMAYVGGYFEGVPFAQAIGAHPTAGLTLGTFAGLLAALGLYVPRRIMSVRQFMNGVIDGIKTMIPALTILILAWSLGGVCREMIGTGSFVSQFVRAIDLPFAFLPAIVFAVAAFLSFSTGTAWGTFGILLPIVLEIFTPGGFDNLTAEALNEVPILMVGIGATLGGAVCGDHCSPISDTTIMASSGAQCYHLNHVATQLPYALTVAAISFVNYIITGLLIGSVPEIVCLLIAIATTVGVMVVIGKMNHSMTTHSVR